MRMTVRDVLVCEMDTVAAKLFFLLLLSVFRIPEVSSKKMADLKPKKKLHFDLHDMLKSNQIHHEEESEEEVSGEGRFGHYLGEPDEEASQRGVAYYAIPTPEYSNAIRVYMKPVFLYNDSFDRKHPPRYEYHRFEGYNYPEDNYQESRYHVNGFPYK